ncbi:hypothetical protein K933_02061 [Candidatus Halobonum tyrrellensis G22]|uniref:Uncharacterized protein n=1 Tax=Candidatus Halobonum tyrrellensis G22 TaxID=1324957 RepID=V4HIW5_9EURY|nr:hypothetical protein K933_02061 [Candidatus Halobonum tyrrellensis G22]
MDAPVPAQTTVTATFVADRFPEATVECGSCGMLFETTNERAVYYWDADPWVRKPAQVRRRSKHSKES